MNLQCLLIYEEIGIIARDQLELTMVTVKLNYFASFIHLYKSENIRIIFDKNARVCAFVVSKKRRLAF